MKNRKLLIIYLILISLASLFIGAIEINLINIFEDTKYLNTILITRLPRLLSVVLTATALSVSGLIMQKLTMNNFVSPTTGATISSAQLGILISIIFFPQTSLMSKTIFSFVFSIIGTLVFVGFISKMKFKNKIMIPLVGIMFSNIISGVTSYLAYITNTTQTMSTWMVGNFSLILRGRYEIVYLVLPLVIIAFLFSSYFNIVSLGENVSKNLGISYESIVTLGLIIASLMTASTIVVVGSISFVGLIIPNIISLYKGDNIKNTLLDTAILGSCYLLTCDVIARLIIPPYELPVQLVSGVLGSIIFIYLIFAPKKTNPRRLKNG